MERAAGIEPACLTWKDSALPLSYARCVAAIMPPIYLIDQVFFDVLRDLLRISSGISFQTISRPLFQIAETMPSGNAKDSLKHSGISKTESSLISQTIYPKPSQTISLQTRRTIHKAPWDHEFLAQYL